MAIATNAMTKPIVKWKRDKNREDDGANQNHGGLASLQKKDQCSDAARAQKKTAKRDLVRTIRGTKRNYCRDLCQELDNNIWGKAYKIVAKQFNTLTPYNLSVDRKRQILKARNNNIAVSQVSVPGPPLWKILHDDVLPLGTDNDETLIENTNTCRAQTNK
ncbi:hypothetical protein QE152_g9619 [Popillia japonica]|uniref:Uncharacterized protein n=1 Tax=Popillia japonica TaxID=7064 RepID=A0AAW1LY69_POPJA